MDIKRYWNAVLKQQAEEMRCFFYEDASVNWHNTNEHFTADEFVEINCRYPRQWDGDIERVVENGDVTVAAVHVFSYDKKQSFCVTSFNRLLESLEENEKNGIVYHREGVNGDYDYIEMSASDLA